MAGGLKGTVTSRPGYRVYAGGYEFVLAAGPRRIHSGQLDEDFAACLPQLCRYARAGG